MVFMKFHQTRSAFDPKYSVLQWLFVISRSTFIDLCRKKQREVPRQETDDLENLAATASAETLPSPEPELLKRVPAGQREAVRLRVLDELTYEEIAERLGRTEAGIRQTVSRALRRLKLDLKKGENA